MFLTRGKQRGYGVIIDPAKGAPEEVDSFTCCHCGNVKWLEPQKVTGNVVSNAPNEALAARCTCCDKLMCLDCVGKGCIPLERALQKMERRREYDEAVRG